MAGTQKSGAKIVAEEANSENMADTQSYLITSYRESLKKGDKSAAKSCLLAARYFSVNDPNVTNEIYLMAKSDGDVGEASKCFANMFNDLFLSTGSTSPKVHGHDLSPVINQIKEETRALLAELKSHLLKLKSVPAPAPLASRQAPSIQPSPMLSPRVRTSSEDRVASRESVSKLDSHLHSSTRGIFYQQLFENLPESIIRGVLDHSIDTCDNAFERCRLMMLAISIYSDSVATYGGRLLRTLIDLAEPEKSSDEQRINNPRSPLMRRYAKSLLVLDAIPLVLKIPAPSNLNIEFGELFEKTLNFYSEHCLELAAIEYGFDELHDGVRKTIANRILGTEYNSTPDDAIEDQLITTLNLLSHKFIETADETVRGRLEELRSLVSSRNDLSTNLDKIIAIMHDTGLDCDIPDDTIARTSKSPQPTITQAPRGRGRAKKVQQSVIVSLDDEVKKNTQNKLRDIQFVFFSIVQHMFVNLANYLKNTRSRILINFSNPIASQLESELTKGSSQRGARTKHNLQSNEAPAKRIKLDLEELATPINISPLNSEESRMLDHRILTSLIEAQKCLGFLNLNIGAFTKIWHKFLANNGTAQLTWYRRFLIDSLLLSEKYEDLSRTVISFYDDSEKYTIVTNESTSNIANTSGRSISVIDIRNLVQLIACYVQLDNRTDAFGRLEELLFKTKQCGLLIDDGNYSEENIDSLVEVQHTGFNNIGFLFFDTISVLRYCVDLLMNIMKKCVKSNMVSDIAIGHSLVLSQFDWPRESQVYDSCVSWIRSQKPKSATPQCLSASTKFTYPEFFQYIRNPNIIEDFMALLRQGYTLDIKSNSTSGTLAPSTSQARNEGGSRGSSNSTTRSGKAITTRGVNKTFKEDLKVAIITQMRNSSTQMSLDTISDFMQSLLLPYLKSSLC